MDMYLTSLCDIFSHPGWRWPWELVKERRYGTIITVVEH
jgi:hypothetical protein